MSTIFLVVSNSLMKDICSMVLYMLWSYATYGSIMIPYTLSRLIVAYFGLQMDMTKVYCIWTWSLQYIYSLTLNISVSLMEWQLLLMWAMFWPVSLWMQWWISLASRLQLTFIGNHLVNVSTLVWQSNQCLQCPTYWRITTSYSGFMNEGIKRSWDLPDRNAACWWSIQVNNLFLPLFLHTCNKFAPIVCKHATAAISKVDVRIEREQ